MKGLILLTVVGACVAFPFIQDAPDVAAEKAAFLKVFNAAHAAAIPRTPSGQVKWTGPFAATVAAGLPGSSAVVANTADVNAALDAFSRTYNAQLAAVGAKVPHGATVWTGPLAATVAAGLPGSSANVAPTADVAAANAAFFNTYKQQVAATAVRV